MPRYIAFLRGINLGRRRLTMDELRARFVELKFAHVATFIASGNVIFDSPARNPAKLTRMIEAHLARKLGYEVDTFLRTRAEVATVAAFRPFPPDMMEAEGTTTYCSFLKEPLSAAQARGLIACRTPVDEFCVAGREFYWLCRIKSNESKVWSSPALRALKLPSSSARNLTTVRKLAALFPPDPA
ncbi:MAG: DUF1697 domain-containing protein [Verrucomicrobia bacterium]|nr:DUF1697 domain-containing protein [Verrucomicrobiota bacterium]